MTFGVGHASPSTYLQYSVTFNETVCLAAVFKSVEEGHGIPVDAQNATALSAKVSRLTAVRAIA